MLGAEVNESIKIIIKHNKKGFRILDVRLAIRFLITVCISPQLSCKSTQARPAFILAYSIHLPTHSLQPSHDKRLLRVNLLDVRFALSVLIGFTAIILVLAATTLGGGVAG
ncbi:hypothetical protein ACFLUU_10610 [Chloroflexota bacterium]